MPASPWEFDEVLFYEGLQRFDPVAHHPPPPGYPVFMAAGKVARSMAPSDFAALSALSLIGSTVGFVMLALAFRNMAGDLTAGLAGAALFYFSPVQLVHAAVPISDPGALGLLATALYFGSRGDSPGRFAMFASLAIGWRIQFTIFALPLFLIAVILMKKWRDRGVALATFTVVCLAWLIPLAIAVGGLEELVQFQMGQGKYLAAHDAEQSRSGWTPAMIALRFVAHPWGAKVTSFPLLLAAAIGFVVAVRKRRLPMAMTIAGAIYIAFALWVMDPADGVRYALPFVLVTAFYAGVGAVAASRRLSIPAPVLPIVFAAGSLIYVSSLLYQRATIASPPLRAIDYARRTYPVGAVAVYELPLWPHAMYYLRDHRPQRLDDAMAAYYDRPDVPMFLIADGAARGKGSKTFAWAPSDAYSKLTRNHYRVASVIPLPPDSRFRTIRGIYGPEREPDGDAWRWLAPVAEFQVPTGGRRVISLQTGLPSDSAIAWNELEIDVNGARAATGRVRRGVITTIELPVAAGSPVVTVRAAQSFVPAAISGSLSRDPRRLAVKLFGVTTR